MSATRWLQGARDELQELAPLADQRPADAWRAATLIVRLLNGPAPQFAPSPEFVQRLPRLIVLAGPPDAQRILDCVSDALDSFDDPWGPLADALLDADDAVSVMAYADEMSTASALAERVAALVALWPERVLALGDFAQMRLESMHEGVAASRIWRVVVDAPALLLVDALPASRQFQALRPVRAVANVVAFRSKAREYEVPRMALLAAADSGSELEFPLEVEGESTQAWIYAEKGRMCLELANVDEGAAAELVVRVDGSEAGAHSLDIRVDGSTGYGDLGEWAGSANLLHRLVAESGAPLTRVSVAIRITYE